MEALSRRRFLQSAGVLALGAVMPFRAFAGGVLQQKVADDYRLLTIGYRNLDIKGRAAKVYGLLDASGKLGLTFNKGDNFKVKLQNDTKEPTLIHWHGLTPPFHSDGVPDVSQALLPAGQDYLYDFPLARSGTNWMHAHTLQEQNLLAAPLIIRENTTEDEQEVVILLHDFSFKSPEELLAGLQKGMTHGQHDMASMGANMDMTPEEMANMPMSSLTMDVNDIEYDAYLANDRTLDDPEVVKVEAGGRVRLRIINGATSTGFTINLGKMSGELIAVDGMNILPIKGRTFPISMGQRLDIRLQMPKDALAYPILAQRENSAEQTGIILAPTNAKISKIASQGRKNAPILDLSLEKRLVSAEPLTEKTATIKAAFELDGTMSPYIWSIKKVGGMGNNALTVTEGDRVQITLKNNSMMAHPIHLHGHHFQVASINGKAMNGAVRDTLLLPPNTTASIIFDADNAGKWPLHCHHLYHMATGMMTFVNYKGVS